MYARLTADRPASSREAGWHPVGRRLAAVIVGTVLLVGLIATPATAVSPAVPATAAAAAAVEFTGLLSALVGDDFVTGRSGTFGYSLATASGTYSIEGSVNGALVGRRVVATGTLSGATLTLARDGLREAADGAAQAVGSATAGPITVSAAPSVVKVAVILFTFTDKTYTPYTAAQVNGQVLTNALSTSALFRDASGGAITSFTGTVYGYYALPIAAGSSCDLAGWSAAAETAAAANGFVASDYTHVIYGFARTSSCLFGGLANMPGNRIWINAVLDYATVAHEFGHNFGFNHSGSLWCTDPTGITAVAWSERCTLDPTNNPFDIMGYRAGMTWPNAVHLAHAGWIPPASIDTVTTEGTYHLNPMEVAGSHRLLIIPKATSPAFGTGESLALELRKNIGLFEQFGAGSPAVNGVSIHAISSTSDGDTPLLVDTTPATTGTEGVFDAQLMVGKSFVDRIEGLTITLTAIDATGATIEITKTADTTAPEVAGPILDPASAGVGTPVGGSVDFADGSGVAGGWARLDNGAWTPLTLTGTGIGAPAQATFDTGTLGTLTEGGHLVCVIGVDGAGNVGGGSDCTSLTVTGSKPKPAVSVSAKPAHETTTFAITATLLTAGGAPIAGKLVGFSIGGNTASATTGADGQATTTILAPAATHDYPLTAVFAGDDAYGAAAGTLPVTVTPIGPPTAPLSATAVAGDQNATVTWTPPVDDGGRSLWLYTVTAAPGGATCGAAAPDVTCIVYGLVNGTSYTFTVDVQTIFSTTSPASSASNAVVPGLPPVARMTAVPAWSLGGGVQLGWGTTSSYGPIAGYDVQVRTRPWNGAFGAATTLVAGTAAKTAWLALTPGKTACARVRATDSSGRTSSWTAETCTSAPLDERSLVIGTGWTKGTGSAYYRSTYLTSKTRGVTLTRTGIVAKSVSVVVQTCSTCGSIGVYWNNVLVKTVSLRSATTVNKKSITVLSFSSVRTGTLKLRVSSSGAKVLVDGVGIRGV